MLSPRLFLPVLFLLWHLLPAQVAAQIYADVTVSGGVSGTFTITLEEQKAPVAVANFIGLATGKNGWLDSTTGAIRYDGFYNGVTFHRVISGFMSQTGSRLGDGTDGPGYVFKNEPNSLSHATLYTVAMFNAGADTNGSQWYVTSKDLSAGTAAALNGNYTIFGHVDDAASRAVCDAINTTPTTGSSGTPADKPLTAVVIQSVTIRGPSLSGFNLNPFGLPKLLNGNPALTKTSSSLTLGFDLKTFSAYTVYDSSDLVSWAQFASGYFGPTPPTGTLDVTPAADVPKHFYRIARADYSGTAAKWTPASIANRSFTFTTNFPLITDVTFDATGTGGTWRTRNKSNGSTAATGSITYVSFGTGGPYSPNLQMVWNSTSSYGFDFVFNYTLGYTSANGGTVSGTTNVIFDSTGSPTSGTSLSGTFTTSP